MSEKINFPPRVTVAVNALAIGIANSLWDQLDGDPDLPLTQCGGWRQYVDKALEEIGMQNIVNDIYGIVYNEWASESQERLQRRVFGPDDDTDQEPEPWSPAVAQPGFGDSWGY